MKWLERIADSQFGLCAEMHEKNHNHGGMEKQFIDCNTLDRGTEPV